MSNLMRKEHRELNYLEKQQIENVKDCGADFIGILHNIGQTAPANEGDKQASRELALAQTKIEEAVMWAVKAITR